MAVFGRRSTPCLYLGFIALFSPCILGAGFAGGTGTRDDPYQIATVAQLLSIGADPDLLAKHFILVADIDVAPGSLGGRVFQEALIAPALGKAGFSGSFDGQGHVIRNFTLQQNARSRGYVGLFGYIERTGWIRNLGLEDIRIGAGDEVGGLAYANSGILEDCYTTGSIRCGSGGGGLVGSNWGDGSITRCHSTVAVQGGDNSESVGGLVGYNTGTITNCYATGSVAGGDGCWAIGGLVGMMGSFGCFVINERGLIANCYAMANVSVGEESWYTGGLVGLSSEGSIANCHASGPVTTGDNSDAFGGLVGGNGAPGGYAGGPGVHMGTILHCYAVGAVTCGGRSAGGGLVGENFDGTVTGSFWDVESSGRVTSEGGQGLTPAEMRDPNVFRNAGWDWIEERANGTAELWFMPGGAICPALAALSDEYQPRALPGTGTLNDPYRIATAEDLGAICHYSPSAYYELTADVDLSGITWSASPLCDLHGRLDGHGFAVSGLRLNGGGHLGLFGVLNVRATVANLRLKEAEVTGATHGSCLGVLAGINWGTITRCRAEGTITVGDSAWYVGGLVGLTGSDLSECCAEVRMDAGDDVAYIGGLVGSGAAIRLSDCYARGTITLGEHGGYAGGLVAEGDYGMIVNCYAGVQFLGSGTDTPGRLVGSAWKSTITSSYFLSPLAVAGPSIIGSPLTDRQMTQQASFVGWDFDRIWTICEGKDYPRFQWERVSCP